MYVCVHHGCIYVFIYLYIYVSMCVYGMYLSYEYVCSMYVCISLSTYVSISALYVERHIRGFVKNLDNVAHHQHSPHSLGSS